MRLAALALALSVCVQVAAQDSAPKYVTFEFEQAGVAVPHWGLSLSKDGAGEYWETAPVSERNPAGRTTRPIAVSKATLDRIAEGQRVVLKHLPCETRLKNIAKTGVKTVSYAADGLTGSCVFNFSDDAGLMDALAAFEAVAETIQMGERLERERRYDRLGLDADMFALRDELKSGRAIEPANIAPTLRAIVRDTELMQRVRALAAQWLAEMPSTGSQ